MHKRLVAALVALSFAVPVPAFAAMGAAAATSAAPAKVVLDVRNMTCELCPITVGKALDKVPGVVGTKIDLAAKTATVTFDPKRADVAALVKATTDAGYPSTARPSSHR
jgi:mercuric ion binding protein